jgi:hypothetical protein
MADSTAVVTDYISSTAAIENKKDSTHKFIRTADLKFKVKDVIKSTYNIEDITTKMGGFVTYTNLTSVIDDAETSKITTDSLLITTHYTVHNTITIRVPNTKLDTTLKAISTNIDFLDFRIIKADDIAIQLLSNNLTIKRSKSNESRITKAIDNRGKKLNETTAAEEILLSKQEKADNARISNLTLQDQMKFSTINIEIYQRPSTKHEIIANPENTDEYKPEFGHQLLGSFKFGWDMFKELILFITKLWGVCLFALIAFIVYKMYVVRFKKRKLNK